MLRHWTLLSLALWCLAAPRPALAYIGPGAGFALAGSLLAVAAAVVAAGALIVFWPVRWVLRRLWRRRPAAEATAKQVVILGLDGLDYGLTRRLMSEGKLPALSALAQEGCFKPLASTLPPISPVAWSTFQTGVNPGKHNIFDFLSPDRGSYQPRLSSVEIRNTPPRWNLGRIGLIAGRARLRLLRKSQPFWRILSDYGVFNCILRVPISFPPEPLRGVQLSAMCVPDLRGTQGTFTRFTSREGAAGRTTGGETRAVTRSGGQFRGSLVGPPHPGRPDAPPLECPFSITLQDAGHAKLRIGQERHDLRPGQYTDWVRVEFPFDWGRTVRGVCRFLLLQTEPDFELYVTPIQLDPERPAMPIGYPPAYPVYLAKRQGPFATLGLAEDTWGLSEDVLTDDAFVQQCTDIDREREAMFFDGLEQTPEGLCVCVFDGPDRMQHMFWRYLDREHPARPAEIPAAHRQAIEDLYVRMDGLVGRTIDRCRNAHTCLMVISDHGFNSFRRGVDLNRWLEEQGYLTVDDARRGEEHLAGVDWSRTRAFAIGLSGIYINARGRFSAGVVEPGVMADALRQEIASRLAQLVDPRDGALAIHRVYQAVESYRGPYVGEAPDLIVGYANGYRVSWESAAGRTSTAVFQDNHKAWSGDHCVDPSVVPGVLFCNRAIEAEHPRLLDLAPTVLSLFGIPAPEYMDGRALPVGTTAEIAAMPRPLEGVAP